MLKISKAPNTQYTVKNDPVNGSLYAQLKKLDRLQKERGQLEMRLRGITDSMLETQQDLDEMKPSKHMCNTFGWSEITPEDHALCSIYSQAMAKVQNENLSGIKSLKNPNISSQISNIRFIDMYFTKIAPFTSFVEEFSVRRKYTAGDTSFAIKKAVDFIKEKESNYAQAVYEAEHDL